MKLVIFAAMALVIAMWLGATCGHIMDRRFKAHEIAIERAMP